MSNFRIIIHIDGKAYGPFPPNSKDVQRLRHLKGVRLEYIEDRGGEDGKQGNH